MNTNTAVHPLSEDAAQPWQQGPVQTPSHHGGLLHPAVLPRRQGEEGAASRSEMCITSAVTLTRCCSVEQMLVQRIFREMQSAGGSTGPAEMLPPLICDR